MSNVASSFCHRFVLFLFLVYWLASNAAHAQQDKFDSLNSLLNSTGRDSMRASVLLQLSREMYRSGRYVDEARYATEALKLSQLVAYINGEGD